MRWLTTIFREILGLFVDEWSFALAIVAWVGVVWFALASLRLPATVSAIVLFTGLALILVESLLRFARNKRR